MPPTKAAKKAAKKSAKKAAKTAAKHPAHDLRRAYEHLGRIEALQPSLPPEPSRNVALLGTLAQQELAAGHPRAGADLLRAAEHLSFAALAPAAGSASRVSPDLQAAIRRTFDDLLERAAAAQAGLTPQSVAVLFAATVGNARAALAASAWRQALELARAAEALTHTGGHGPARISASSIHPPQLSRR